MPTILVALVLLAQSPAIVDRTLAIVGGRAITLSDARTALALGLIDGEDVDAGVVRRLVDRDLMLREADRYEPPEPTAERVEARLEEIRARAGGDAALRQVLEAGGFTGARLEAWVRDDLRVAAYVRQRFAADDR